MPSFPSVQERRNVDKERERERERERESEISARQEWEESGRGTV